MSEKTPANILEVNFKRHELFVVPYDRADIQLHVCMFVIKNYLAEEPEFAVSTIPDHIEDGVSVGAYNAPFYGAVCGEIAVNIAVAAGKLDDLTGDLLLRLCKSDDFVVTPNPVEWGGVLDAYKTTEAKITKYLEDYKLGCKELNAMFNGVE